MKTRKTYNYNTKQRLNGRGDTYGTFREGKQVSADIIGGKVIPNIRKGLDN